jgi:hypothetical protein
MDPLLKRLLESKERITIQDFATALYEATDNVETHSAPQSTPLAPWLCRHNLHCVKCRVCLAECGCEYCRDAIFDMDEAEEILVIDCLCSIAEDDGPQVRADIWVDF